MSTKVPGSLVITSKLEAFPINALWSIEGKPNVIRLNSALAQRVLDFMRDRELSFVEALQRSVGN